MVNTLLGKDGLNYGALPKGLLKFHRYAEGARTPLEEHLVEGTLYAKGKDGKVNVHFTVSPEPTRQAELSYAVFCLKKKKKIKKNVSMHKHDKKD